jgi:hypothetical protein
LFSGEFAMANTSQHVAGQCPTKPEEFASNVGQTLQPGSSAAGGIVDTVTEKAKNLASSASNLASEAKETVQEWSSTAAEAASRAKQKGEAFVTTAAHQAECLGEDLTNLIRRYPMQALLIGFGAGFLLSRLRRR